MSSSTSSAVDYSGIRVSIRVYGIDAYDRAPSNRNRRDAARFITQGLRVTDDYGFNLTIETRADGTQRVVRGEDPYGAYNERRRLETITRREQGQEYPPRVLTDYEEGAEHPLDCGILNCDHPVHFGGNPDGKITFEKPDSKKDGEGNAGGAGASA